VSQFAVNYESGPSVIHASNQSKRDHLRTEATRQLLAFVRNLTFSYKAEVLKSLSLESFMLCSL